MKLERVIISGGGTGGHIYPAIAIAKAIQLRFPDCNILFVGAKGRMEMEKVPQAGFQIHGLTIAGFNRKSALRNIGLPFKVLQSLFGVRSVLRKFNPQVVIGVGGYASGPTLKMAQWMKIPTVIQEQNSFPGKTNLLLAKKAYAIAVAYDGMERFFPKEKLVKTGNPVRTDIMDWRNKRSEGYAFYRLDPCKRTVLIIGGSLGAKTLNESVLRHLISIGKRNDIQAVWQCGATNFSALKDTSLPSNVHLFPFIEKMDLAYAVADIIVSRAGATSISELSLVEKPSILVPSPNVAEDHQTKNALALVQQEAAILVADAEAPEQLWKHIFELLNQETRCSKMSEAIRNFALPLASDHIVNICTKAIAHE
jgi:UDP-N-acetylglucosamine--N-acetylmuramyl-(pentapeptide) pyrophosphoryl-undecaprenol N-acetylglucosamine transferase